MLAAYSSLAPDLAQVYNVAVGERSSLVELHQLIGQALVERKAISSAPKPSFTPFRSGDVRHSLADISEAQAHLRYEPTHSIRSGMTGAVGWYIARYR